MSERNTTTQTSGPINSVEYAGFSQSAERIRSRVWTIAEQRDGCLKPISFELLARGRRLADKLATGLAAVILGSGIADEELERLIIMGADEVLYVQADGLGDFICESHSRILEIVTGRKRPSIILAGATSTGRTLMPYLAVKLGAGLTADCTGLDIEEGTDNLLQTRPAIGGNIMATIRTADRRPQMATVRPRSTRPLAPDPLRKGTIFRIVPNSTAQPRVRVIGYRTDSEGTGDIEEAEVVVSGGKGLMKAENFSLVRELADRLDGAVGASRDAVDRGWIEYAHQVGLSGKTISPRLYLCAGISGSIQHLAGIKTAENIVAVNIDPDAPIHSIADFSIVGDLFEVLPLLSRRLAVRLEKREETTAPKQAQRPDRRGGTTPPAVHSQSKPANTMVLAAKAVHTTYNPVTPEAIRRLEEIVGQENVTVDAEKLESYSHDETPAEEYGHMPDVVITPTRTEEVAAVVRLANELRIPVTPRGAGSGLSAGAVPAFGGIVVSLEKMNRIIEIDEQNMTIEAETGIITNELGAAAEERGLYYAGYPMSLQTCFLGGNIAENAGGGKAIKYGVTGRYVLGMELVTPTGDIVRLGGKLSKDVTGYDLKQLIVGSEGTLGIVTSAIIKLIGKPTVKADLLVLFESPAAAIGIVPTIMTQGIVPTSIEFMDRVSVETTCRYLNESLPYEQAGAMLLIELDGTRPEQVEADLVTIGELCRNKGAQEVYVAEDANTQERIWNVRRNIAEAFKVAGPVQSLEDIVVPPAAIPEIIPELERLSAKYQMRIPCYGHAGDGNLHATLVKDQEMTMEEWHHNEKSALRELYAIVKKLGGKISGEHGIGLKRKSYYIESVNPVELRLMQGIKRAWDPNNIMNPGKIFDLDSREHGGDGRGIET